MCLHESRTNDLWWTPLCYLAWWILLLGFLSGIWTTAYPIAIVGTRAGRLLYPPPKKISEPRVGCRILTDYVVTILLR